MIYKMVYADETRYYDVGDIFENYKQWRIKFTKKRNMKVEYWNYTEAFSGVLKFKPILIMSRMAREKDIREAIISRYGKDITL